MEGPRVVAQDPPPQISPWGSVSSKDWYLLWRAVHCSEGQGCVCFRGGWGQGWVCVLGKELMVCVYWVTGSES